MMEKIDMFNTYSQAIIIFREYLVCSVLMLVGAMYIEIKFTYDPIKNERCLGWKK